VALLVSGGHTQLVAVEAIGRYRLLGETLDDAAGEAFDKTAKMMGLPYPGGPQLAALAERAGPGKYKFARPMTDRPGLDFSFSGLKTQVLLAWRDSDHAAQTRADIARAFEDAVVDTLAIKCQRALDATGFDTLVIAGGVGANKRLRARLQAMAEQRGGRVSFPAPDVLHRQRRNDRLRRRAAPAGGAARRCLGAGDAALGHVDSAGSRVAARLTRDQNRMDKVFIEALEIEALIGIYDWERRIRQPLLFDVEMSFDNRIPAASDAIADTLNYKASASA
jgi:hypothetical protein